MFTHDHWTANEDGDLVDLDARTTAGSLRTTTATIRHLSVPQGDFLIRPGGEVKRLHARWVEAEVDETHPG